MEEKNEKPTMLQFLEELEAASLLKDEDKIREAQAQISEKFFKRYANFIKSHSKEQVEEFRKQFLALYKKLK